MMFLRVIILNLFLFSTERVKYFVGLPINSNKRLTCYEVGNYQNNSLLFCVNYFCSKFKFIYILMNILFKIKIRKTSTNVLLPKLFNLY